MGKKSKNQNKKAKAKPRIGRNDVHSGNSSDYISSLIQKLPTPQDGWARELRQAEKELKGNPDSEEIILRTARAYIIMRQFKALKNLSHESLSLSEEGGKQLNELLYQADRAEAEMGKPELCASNHPEFLKQIYDTVKHEGTPLYFIRIDDPQYGHINPLHYAAKAGDIRLLEHLVARGMPLDRPTEDLPMLQARCKLPGATALILALQMLLVNKSLTRIDRRKRRLYDGQLQCAIQLVRLGADYNATLPPLAPDYANDLKLSLPIFQDTVGESAYQLATILGEQELIDAMDQLSTNEDKIELVHCRCGSRLPWKECHHSKNLDSKYYEQHDGIFFWKWPPLSICPTCDSKKTYFRCPCWSNPSFHTFLQDSTGKPVKNRRGDMYGSFSHPKWRRSGWSTDVNKGVMERIEIMPFQWKDTHWHIPKAEVLHRTREWNKALEKYCDDMGLEGAKKEKVIEVHSASALAPCANVSCDKHETKVKEFRTCSSCKSVAYCSLECQREDWKTHNHNKECAKFRRDFQEIAINMKRTLMITMNEEENGPNRILQARV